jgi:GMP synthase-like glutamine amidotransferase
VRLHYLQHVPFEDPAGVLLWAEERGISVSSTKLYENGLFPAHDSFDLLVVMGGPMSANKEDRYGWLAAEKRFIADAIKEEKRVLGICLGAQLIASALGARVYKNRCREIGWFPVARTESSLSLSPFSALPRQFIAFHWHGETFDIPHGAVHAAATVACEHQAFMYGNRTIGLQFHIESTAESIVHLVSNCRDELDGSQYVQSAEKILAGESNLGPMRMMLDAFLDSFTRETVRPGRIGLQLEKGMAR